MTADARSLEQAGTHLEREVHRVRMLPFGDGCQGLERAVRDVARISGKEVELHIEGVDVEVDRSILEGLRDPLLHLVRNAVDHGVELPAKRLAAGKPAQARITVSATLRGSQVEVVVGDDGAGLNFESIRAQAAKRSLPAPDDERELARVLFMPGFSTAPIVTDISGRGVGLDVVKSRIESLRGAVDVVSEPGRGTRFILTVPLTLTTIAALLVRCGGQTLALASANVRALVRFGAEAVRRAAGREVLLWNGEAVTLASLSGTLGLPRAELPPPQPHSIAVIVAAKDKQAAFLVDEALEEQTIVVKSLGARVRRVRFVSGASLLPSGSIALLLNAHALLDSAAAASSPVSAPAAESGPKRARRRILVAEDSLTTRTLVKSILESHNYEVATAVDGQEAWDLLQKDEFHLVVSDVEMPRMDGFALTAAIRGSKRLAKLPVVLVTALAADRDKARGIEVGADAYLVKSGFDQSQLLETIAQLR
jgi:two-component system chemotaxis sensor kinase CheA